MSSTKPTTESPRSCRRYSTRCSAFAGTCVRGRQIDIASIRSVRLPLTVTRIGRVCGTGIGMACTHVVVLTANLSTMSSTAAAKRSHWKSGSKPVSSRNGWPSSSRASESVSRDGS